MISICEVAGSEVLAELRHALQHPRFTRVQSYDYLVSPLETIPGPTGPELVGGIVAHCMDLGVTAQQDVIVCFEAMSIQLGAVLSQQTSKPMAIARKKKLDIHPRLEFGCRTRSGERSYCLYGSFRDKRLLLVDDVVASGSTLRQATLAIRRHGGIVDRMLVVVARGHQYRSLAQELGVQMVVLAHLDNEEHAG